MEVEILNRIGNRLATHRLSNLVLPRKFESRDVDNVLEAFSFERKLRRVHGGKRLECRKEEIENCSVAITKQPMAASSLNYTQDANLLPTAN